MREAELATAEEVQDQVPMSPEEQMAAEREKALADFKAVIATKPGKAAVQHFLNSRATGFLTQAFGGMMTRKQRRLAARQVAKRMTKKVMAGEEVF